MTKAYSNAGNPLPHAKTRPGKLVVPPAPDLQLNPDYDLDPAYTFTPSFFVDDCTFVKRMDEREK